MPVQCRPSRPLLRVRSSTDLISSIEGLDGWRHLSLDDVGSTNTVAFERASQGDAGRLWITARSQNAGKARRGRHWVSEPGNLYASLLLLNPAPADALATLPLVVSLALHKAIGKLCPDLSDVLKIKWPNDILLDGKKLSGILLEAANDKHGRLAVVIGMGINCTHFPDSPLYPSTSLGAEGHNVTPEQLFEQLAKSMAEELRIWSAGAGFSIIRREWLERAKGLGERIIARFPDEEIEGRFLDLDDNGFLQLEEDTGQVRHISAADIFFGNSPPIGA